MIKDMMNKFGALLFVAVAAQTLPLNAQGVSPAAQDQNAQNHVVATQAATIDASDMTGSIDKGAKVKVTVSPVDPKRATEVSSQGNAPISYEEAFRNWRLALRQAIGLRPRGYQTVDAGPRN